MRPVAFLAVLLAAAGCGSRTTPSPAEPVAAADPEVVTSLLFDVVEADTRLSEQVPLGPGEYDALAERIAALPGVESAAYAGDGLGTIYLKVEGGGLMVYQHLEETWDTDARAAPASADFAGQLHPTYNAGWIPDPVESNPDAESVVSDLAAVLTARAALVAADASNGFATHFPVARLNPDPEYRADDQVTGCAREGRIAVVDNAWAEHRDGHWTFDVGGVNLWPRLKMMAQAAGFEIERFDQQAPATTIGASNLDRLEDYTIVIFIGHGGAPRLETAIRGSGRKKPLGTVMPSIVTHEAYLPGKLVAGVGGRLTYEEAWRRGYLVQAPKKTLTHVWWTPWLFRDRYRPAKPQMVLLNTCFGLTVYGNFGFVRNAESGAWEWTDGGTQPDHVPIYNFGDGLRGAGVDVVFGFVTRSEAEAITRHTVTFFRRLLGGNWSGDRPPYPHHHWPTCMGAQTFFRDPADPFTARYVNKQFTAWSPEGQGLRSVYTMYATDRNMTFRSTCPGAIPLAYMQDAALSLGTPATEFLSCWNQYWSHGEYPSMFVNEVCSWGDDPTTYSDSVDAGCAVKIARKVTNAMLETTAPPP